MRKRNRSKKKIGRGSGMERIGMKFKNEDELYEAATVLDKLQYEYEAAGDDTLIISVSSDKSQEKLEKAWAEKKILPKKAEFQNAEDLSGEERKFFYRNRFIGVPFRKR
jgi:hypothetical protein